MNIQEDLEGKYYKFKEQIKVYNTYKSNLSDEDKYDLIETFLSGRDFWGYFELITTIAYELADDSDKYLGLLEKINNKIKREMAQKPFLDLLKDVGRNKEDIALKLYTKIINKSKDNDLKVASGLILGSYSQKHDGIPKSYLSKKIKYPLTNSLLKAILVKYEKSKLPKEIYNYFDKISKTQDKNILKEFTNICLVFYKKNRTYFYNKIHNLIKLKEKSMTYLIFDRLAYQKILNQKQLFELIEYSKDLDDFIINKIIEVLRNYPQQYKQISEWFIYWLNKDLEFKLKHFDWVLEELAKKNKLFIKYFLENYHKLQDENYKRYMIVLPHLFRALSKYHKDYALKQLFKFKLNEKDEKYLFFELTKVLIGNIYQDIENKDVLIALIDNLIKVAERRDFIDLNKKKYHQRKAKTSFSQEDYDYLIDFANNILNQLKNRKQNYDFKLINKNLKKYKKLYEYAKDVLKDAEDNKKYTPLLWLGENEQPNLDDIKISKNESGLNRTSKIDFARSRFYPQAYLYELNRALALLESKPTERYNNKTDLIKNIKQNLLDDDKFRRFFSELIFINRFDKEIIRIIEPIVPNRNNNYLDLKVHLFGKDIYFEITRPEMDRKLRLANGVVALKNKAFSTIDKKYRQLFAKETLNEIKNGKRKDLFFVVIDRSDSTIDEHQLLDSFLGNLAYTWQIDKKTGKVVNQYMTRKKDGLPHKNKNISLISGVIYFKQELIFIDPKPRIILKGGIIQNPHAKNRLNDKEIKRLKNIIFN